MSTDFAELKNLRREIHSHAELSGEEKKTSEIIAQFLKTCKPDEIITGVGGHGIVASWGNGNKGTEILLRAELDALPIIEINGFDYKSKNNGVSHKCGHDGHSTILCGVAQYLSVNRPDKGKVMLLFQPAEETGEGAKRVIEDMKFERIKPDLIFALHNLPGFPLKEVIVREHAFTAAVNSIIIELHGKTSHAAEPEHGINPALAVAEILKESILMNRNSDNRNDMKVITPVYAELGEKAYGVSAGRAEVHLTLRCRDDESLRSLEASIASMVQRISQTHGLKSDIRRIQSFSACMNDPEAVELVRRGVAVNGYFVSDRKYPFKWGEDFGIFTSRFKGCLFGIGSGVDHPPLHNPDYDFPDELIESGVNIFLGIIEEAIDN